MALNGDAAASQQFYVVPQVTDDEGEARKIKERTQIEIILWEHDGGFVKDKDGFPVIVGGKAGGYLAFGPPKAAFEVAKVALLVDAWTPELTLDVSFDTIDKVIEVELDRKKRTVVTSMKAKEEAGINKTSVMAEDKERREEEKSVDDARLNEIFTELGLEIRKNRFGGSVNSLASMLRDWVVPKTTDYFQNKRARL